MNWDIFWAAFGAIGTTVGSFITAIAVVVAVKQYKQPIEKKIKITHTFAYPLSNDENISKVKIAINIKNAGIRSINIVSVNVACGKGRIYLNRLQSKLQPFDFPKSLEPEEAITFYIERDKFLDEIKRIHNKGDIKSYQKMRFMVEDSLEDIYLDQRKLVCRKGIINKL